VIPEAIWEKVKESFNSKLTGPARLKNKAKEVLVYEVLG
jgi:hypothetical protein